MPATKKAPQKTIIALDVDTKAQALKLARDLKSLAYGFKVGPRLCLRFGRSLIKELTQIAPVMLDNKHYDIPSTVEASVKTSFDMGARFCTVHALCDAKTLRALARLEQELNEVRAFNVISIGVLTSAMKPGAKSQRLMLSRAKKCFAQGLSHMVCSAFEAKALKALNPKARLFVPGIRGGGLQQNDHKRASTPSMAFKAGAEFIIIGRPVYKSPNPKKALKDLLER